MSEFDALAVPPKRRPGRPTKAEVAAREAAKQAALATDAQYQAQIKSAAAGNTLIPERDFHMPVGQNFLARVLNLDAMTCNRRLRRCPPVGYSGTKVKRPLYDFRTAIEYLLKPRMDIETYLATLNPADMPPGINKALWEAKRIKLKFEIEAGQSWATDDVLKVFGEVCMTIKSHTQLWLENLRGIGLTDEAEAKLASMIDSYNNDLHQKLVEMPRKRQTKSRLSAIEREMLEAMRFPDDEEDDAEVDEFSDA